MVRYELFSIYVSSVAILMLQLYLTSRCTARWPLRHAAVLENMSWQLCTNT